MSAYPYSIIDVFIIVMLKIILLMIMLIILIAIDAMERYCESIKHFARINSNNTNLFLVTKNERVE